MRLGGASERHFHVPMATVTGNLCARDNKRAARDRVGRQWRGCYFVEGDDAAPPKK